MDSDRCSVFLLSGSACWGAFNSGNPPEIARVFNHHKVPVTDHLVQEAFEFKRPVVLNDARRDLRMHQATAETANINAMILTPLLDDDTPIGFITAEYNQRRGTFTELDATLLTGVARLAAAIVKTETMTSERDLLGNRVTELQRFEPLGRLAGGLAHDFNNVLTIVLAYCDLIDDDTSELARKNHIESIRNTTLKAGNISRQLLTFAKGGTSNPGPVNLNDDLSNLSPLLTDLLPDSVLLSIELSPEPAWIYADSGEMTQLIMNLVLNARDAITGSGNITIKLTLNDHQVSLKISDSGGGIEDSVLNQIFDPFFSTKDERGIGLGLANVKAIVDGSGGSISVDSSNTGTSFIIVFPEHEPGIKADRTQPPSEPTKVVKQSLTLLLVDDQVDLLQVHASWLKREGYNVFSTSDSLVAKAWIEDFGSEIDLLITDMLMPNLSGADLINAATENDITHALVISGFQGSEIVDLSRPDIKLALLQKPFRPSQLETAIASIITSVS
tara:strand:- start:8076 stop:9581 length:1506 start_codon:yes stop_codon:yes gene_type:complete